MSDTDSEPELNAGDFGSWLDNIQVPVDSEPSDPTGGKDARKVHARRKMKLVHGRDHASNAGAARGGEWAVSFKDPTASRPFPKVSFKSTAPLVPQSRTHSDVWCGTINDSLQLEYLSSRGNLLCNCLLSFRPGSMDDQNRHVWEVVKEFAELNKDFVLEVSKQQTKLNIAMARLGSTAFQCSHQLGKGMDISVAVAPFEKAVHDLKKQSVYLVAKNEMLKKEFTILTKKVQNAVIGDVEIKDAAEILTQKHEELTVARGNYLDGYADLNAEVIKHKRRLVQLHQQLADMEYSAALLKEHRKLLDGQTIDSEKHHFAMAKIETLAHNYFYERRSGDKVVSSTKIYREGAALKKSRRSKELMRLTRLESHAAEKKYDTLLSAIKELQADHKSETEKRKQAENKMKETLKQLKKDYVQKEVAYDRTLETLQKATENTGIVLKNLPLFLKAFKHIHFYNIDIEKTTNKVLYQVQAISENLDDGLRGYKLWDKPLLDHETFSGKFIPMVDILNDEGITECGELAPFNEKEEMKQLMEAILPAIRKNHRELLDKDGQNLRIGFKKNFKKACKQMAEAPEYLRESTEDIGGYLSTTYTAFKHGQELIQKPTPQSLQIELDKQVFTPGVNAIKDAPKDSPVDERKHDDPSSGKTKAKKRSAKDRIIK